MVNETVTGFEEIIKCIIVGDSGVGKTCLTCSYACNAKYDLQKLVKTYQASVWAIDHYRHDKEILDRSWSDIDGCQVSLRLWDTFGYHDKDRRFAYRGADVVVLCFSVMQPNSLLNVRRFWYPEIRRFCPTTPIVLCGTQADLRYLCFDEKYISMEKGLLYRKICPSDIITPNEGREVAKEIGAPYYETSVLTHYGVQDVFVNASRVILLERRKIKFWNTQLRRIQQPLVQAAMKMPVPPAPRPKIPSAVLKTDISAMLNNKSECDVTFLIRDQIIEAHKICLAVASKFFQDLFSVVSDVKLPVKHNRKRLHHKFPNRLSHSDGEHLLDSDCSSTDTEYDSNVQSSAGEENQSSTADCFSKEFTSFPVIIPYDHKAIEALELRLQLDDLDRNRRLRTFVRMCEEILPRPFEVVIEYLYTGSLRPCGVDLQKINRIAEILQLTNLMVIVDNIVSKQDFLNIEMDKQFHENRILKLRELTLNSNFLSDVSFEVDNGVVSAHKALLMGRCEMMYAMFNSDFIESSSDVIHFPGITVETFCALQEYLYTGESPCLSGVDCVTLIEVANRLCLSRLVNMVEASVVAELQANENKDEMLQDALILLEPSELYNATQLTRFCEYILSINYYDMIKKHQNLFRALPQEKQDLIEKKRWPPLWYVKEVEHYDHSTQSTSHFGKQSVVQDYNRRCGCLCFSRREGRKRFRDHVELPL